MEPIEPDQPRSLSPRESQTRKSIMPGVRRVRQSVSVQRNNAREHHLEDLYHTFRWFPYLCKRYGSTLRQGKVSVPNRRSQGNAGHALSRNERDAYDEQKPILLQTFL